MSITDSPLVINSAAELCPSLPKRIHIVRQDKLGRKINLKSSSFKQVPKEITMISESSRDLKAPETINLSENGSLYFPLINSDEKHVTKLEIEYQQSYLFVILFKKSKKIV